MWNTFKGWKGKRSEGAEGNAAARGDLGFDAWEALAEKAKERSPRAPRGALYSEFMERLLEAKKRDPGLEDAAARFALCARDHMDIDIECSDADWAEQLERERQWVASLGTASLEAICEALLAGLAKQWGRYLAQGGEDLQENDEEFASQEAFWLAEGCAEKLGEKRPLRKDLADLAKECIDAWVDSPDADFSKFIPDGLMLEACRAGSWPACMLDGSGRPTGRGAYLALLGLEACANSWAESEAQEDAEGPGEELVRREKLEFLAVCAKGVGELLGKQPEADATAAWLGESASMDSCEALLGASPIRCDGAIEGRGCSSVAFCWLAEGFVRERPDLARARDERGCTLLGKLNEALVVPKGGAVEDYGWADAWCRERSLESLCGMLEAGADPMVLVPIQDPAMAACDPMVKSCVERMALDAAAEGPAPSSSRPALSL